jgi:deoxyribodipyrimidine photo-lyase
VFARDRVVDANAAPVRPGADYLLYWAQMNRRVASNHALAHAIETANEMNLPLLVYEGLTCSYPYANDRLHTFVLEGVRDTAEALSRAGIGYCFYLRKRRADPNDVLYRLAARAALVVTDDYPTFVAAAHNASVAPKLEVRFRLVDSSCVVPTRRFTKREWAAYTIRPKILKLLPDYLCPVPMPDVRRRWELPVPEWHTPVSRDRIAALVADCEIDHSVAPSTAFTGGYTAARARLERFLARDLGRYAEQRNEPAAHATSNLSSYLHFGHISSIEVALAARKSTEFLEELIVRRELAFNFAFHGRFDSLDSLPDWARQTMAAHAADERDPVFTREQLERAETYDPIWNATQKELLLRGTIHGYYRMYWGKKIIEWSATYAEAFDTMVYLHDRYALDGRDPNTYTNILWCFGLHDRPWFERPIFGRMRYMSYDGMRRKTDSAAYIREIEHLERTGQDLLRL